MSDLLAELGRENESDEFEALWGAKFGPSETDTQTGEAAEETPVETTDTETSADERTRDEQGRFTRVDAPAVDEHAREDEIEAEEQAQAGETEPDPLESYLAKYNGNVEAALRAAVEAQKLIGRRDDERNDLRARLEQLETQVRQPQQQAQPQFRPITETDVERLDNMSVGGQGPAAVVEAQRLDPTGILAKRMFDNWAAIAPGEAALFAAEQIATARVEQLRSELQPVYEDRAQSAADQQFVQAWTALSGERPEIEQLAPAMKQVIDARPGLARAILEGDHETKVELLGTVADAARALQAPVVQDAIAQFEAERNEQSKTKKTQAAVTKPKAAIGSVPGGGAQSEKTAAQAEAERIRSGILDSPDTSIVSGWTTE